MLKKLICLLAAASVIVIFGLFAISSSEDSQSSDQTSAENGNEAVVSEKPKNNLGKYNVVIKSCRLAEDYKGTPIVIVTYEFTNNSDDATSFSFSVTDSVFQNGIGLNECYVVDDSANYSSDNQLKDIKPGSTLDVEVAYTLNDNETDLEVEVKELISFKDTVVTKTFKLK